MTGADPGAGRPPEVAAGAIVVEGGRLLLVQRGRTSAVGSWAVPGGRVEAGERVRDAVAREVREETGIEVVVGDFAGWVERIGMTAPDGRPYHYVILDFFAAPTQTGAEPTAGDDATAARWVPLAEVPDLPLVDGLEQFLRDVETLPGAQ